MSDNSKIEWTDATWNPVTGCSVVSPGCTNCYAMKLAGTRLAHHPSRAGLTRDTKAGPVWTGEVRFNEKWLMQPLKWKRQRMVFVCAHGDLFHESIPDEWIDRAFAVMALAPQHTFQVLTKRATRMSRYSNDPNTPKRVAAVIIGMAMRSEISGGQTLAPLGSRLHESDPEFVKWPIQNIWNGVSTEDQRRADERIPDLLATPAAVRWVSAEPLLGPIDFRNIVPAERYEVDALTGYDFDQGGVRNRLDWVVVGGESGPGARPMHPDWARSIRDQCADAGTPFFFKQFGDWAPTGGVDVYCHGPGKNQRKFPASDGVAMLRDGRICMRDFSVAEHQRRILSGAATDSRAVIIDPRAVGEFIVSSDDAGRANDNPLGYQWLYCVGKKHAGRILDGRTHDEQPEARG